MARKKYLSWFKSSNKARGWTRVTDNARRLARATDNERRLARATDDARRLARATDDARRLARATDNARESPGVSHPHYASLIKSQNGAFRKRSLSRRKFENAGFSFSFGRKNILKNGLFENDDVTITLTEFSSI